MKTLLLFLLTLFIPASAFAKCASGSISCMSGSVDSKTKRITLNRNGLIILHFSGQTVPFARELNKTYPVYLLSGGNKVSLLPMETYTGYGTIEVVLKPETLLNAGDTYTLKIDSLPEYYRLKERYNEESKQWVPWSFEITELLDTTIPTLIAAPAERGKKFMRFGCGPVSHVYFSLKGKDNSALFVLATLKSLGGVNKQKHIVKIYGDSVKIGHSMCSGDFSLGMGKCYEITFQLMDQSGNLSAASKPIEFVAPGVNDNPYARKMNRLGSANQ